MLALARLSGIRTSVFQKPTQVKSGAENREANATHKNALRKTQFFQQHRAISHVSVRFCMEQVWFIHDSRKSKNLIMQIIYKSLVRFGGICCINDVTDLHTSIQDQDIDIISKKNQNKYYKMLKNTPPRKQKIAQQKNAPKYCHFVHQGSTV